jgi:hypothetical protein
MNFDEYTDVRVLVRTGTGQASEWQCFLFDPRQGRFLESAELSQVSHPSFDSGTGTITGFARTGTFAYERTTHRWIDGQLVLLRREVEDRSFDAPPASHYRRVWERRGTALALTQSERLRPLSALACHERPACRHAGLCGRRPTGLGSETECRATRDGCRAAEQCRRLATMSPPWPL